MTSNKKQNALFLLVIYITSLFSVFIIPKPVQAWTDNPMLDCQNVIMPNDWAERVKAKAPTFNLNNPNASILVYRTGDTAAQYDNVSVVYYPDKTTKQIEMTKTSGEYDLFFPNDDGNAFWVNLDIGGPTNGSGDVKYEISRNTSPVLQATANHLTAYPSGRNADTGTRAGRITNGVTGASTFPTSVKMCQMGISKNIKYWPSTSGLTALTENNLKNSYDCAVTDFSCWLKYIFGGIGDGFNNVGQAIVSGIGVIFIPYEGSLQFIFDDLTDFLELKLGFLSYPLVFLTDLFDTFNDAASPQDDWVGNVNNYYCDPFADGTWFPEGKDGFFADISIDTCAFEANAPALFDLLQNIMRATIVLLILSGFWLKLRGVLHK